MHRNVVAHGTHYDRCRIKWDYLGIEYYKENIGLNESDHPEDLDLSDEAFDDVSYQTPDLQTAT
jgi:hypothetical protein